MLMPSIFGENLFDDFFNDFPFYDDDKADEEYRKEAVWPQSQPCDEDRYSASWIMATR